MHVALILYLPVWHKGYQLLFDDQQFDQVLLVDPEWARGLDPSLDYLRKEIRALSVDQARQLLLSLFPSLEVLVLDQKSAKSLPQKTHQLIAPDEDVSRTIVKELFPQVKATFVPVFLRWDRDKATKTHSVTADSEKSATDFTKKMLGKAYDEAEDSSDWWRHVGAILTRNKQVLFAAANRHQPSDQSPYVVGDVRQLFKQGEYMNYSTAEHAECSVIAEAARRGVSTKNAQLYVTTFPCPYCARLIAHAGISELYFAEGYATLDGEELLKHAGIKITKVVTPNRAPSRSVSKPYPEK